MSADPHKELSALRLSLLLYVVVFGLKLAAFFATGVLALLAEGLHTLSDVFVSGFLLIAARAARKQSDEEHMFGHGRAQYVGALVAATLFISFTCLELVREAIPHLWHPVLAAPRHVGLAIAVLGASMALAGWPIVRLLAQRTRGAAAKAQLLELINDELGLAAALAGTLLVVAGVPLADPIASLAVAVIIGINGGKLFAENLSFLLGRAPEPEVLAEIERIALSVPGVVSIHRLRAQYIGQEMIHADLGLVLPRGMPIEEADGIADRVEAEVKAATPCSHVLVHIDAAPLAAPADSARP